jgi:hypothetical protein
VNATALLVNTGGAVVPRLKSWRMVRRLVTVGLIPEGYVTVTRLARRQKCDADRRCGDKYHNVEIRLA